MGARDKEDGWDWKLGSNCLGLYVLEWVLQMREREEKNIRISQKEEKWGRGGEIKSSPTRF